jgi:hypothetical protein
MAVKRDVAISPDLAFSGIAAFGLAANRLKKLLSADRRA